MKQKLFALGTIAVIAIVGVFVFEYATSAQRPDRGERGNRNRAGGGRGGPGMMNYRSFIDNSWIDLTFAVQVDDETLVKARPVYQAGRDKIETKLKTLREPGMWESATKEIREILSGVNASLEEILTEEQMAKLKELTKKRATEMQQRMNRARGEGGRRGGGGGGSQ